MWWWSHSCRSASPRTDTPSKRREKSAGVKAVHQRDSPATAAESSIFPPSPEEEEECTVPSIFLQTASYLLDVHALKFAEMSLAHEVTSRRGQTTKTSPTYLVAEARLHLHREAYDEAKKCLKKALKVDIQVTRDSAAEPLDDRHTQGSP